MSEERPEYNDGADTVPKIKPTIGRKVWYTPIFGDAMSTYDDSPCDATIVFVHSDECVNLDVCDHDGQHHAVTSVSLKSFDGDTFCWEWMPYQLGQAAKTEEALREVGQNL